MHKLGVSLAMVVVVPLLAPSGARAESGSLLVVVESAPEMDIGPADVRQAIATELRAPVVAPRDQAAIASERLLVVALDGGAIRMSLRGGTSQAVTRTIPAPPERPARLRAIGWLAGNLARDQVSEIVDAPPASPEPERPPVAAVAPQPAAIQPPPLQPEPRPAPQTSPSLEATGSPASVEGVATRATTPTGDGGRQWMVTATGGPTATFGDLGGLRFGSFREFRESMFGPGYGSIYQLTIQRRSSPGGLIIGAALDVGEPVRNGNLVGVAGLIGTRWERRRWFLEANAGVGLELVRLPVTQSRVVASSASGISSELVTTLDEQPALYASGMGTLGVPVSRLFDLLAQLNLHVTSAGTPTNFLSGSVGVRLRLP